MPAAAEGRRGGRSSSWWFGWRRRNWEIGRRGNVLSLAGDFFESNICLSHVRKTSTIWGETDGNWIHGLDEPTAVNKWLIAGHQAKNPRNWATLAAPFIFWSYLNLRLGWPNTFQWWLLRNYWDLLSWRNSDKRVDWSSKQDYLIMQIFMLEHPEIAPERITISQFTSHNLKQFMQGGSPIVSSLSW